ncbi:MAG: AAA family ATPase [Deltaproteobacteria bacterium]|nr:AAA family ATPase [Deltaproteobacteria bacterium]
MPYVWHLPFLSKNSPTASGNGCEPSAEEYGAWHRESDDSHLWKRTLRENAMEVNLPHSTLDLVYGNAVFDREAGLIDTADEAVSRSFFLSRLTSRTRTLSWAQRFRQKYFCKSCLQDYEVISLDELRVKHCGDRRSQKENQDVVCRAKEMLREGLRAKKGVVWDATSLRRDFRNQLVALAYDYHALVTIVVFQKPKTSFRKDNRAREFLVSDDVLDRQFETYQYPEV